MHSINTLNNIKKTYNNKSIDDFIDTFSDLLCNQTTLYCAVSGGADSMYLFSVLNKKLPKKKLIILHFNHGFRKEANQDIEQIKKTFPDAKIITGEAKNPGSTETVFRRQRYQFFYDNTPKGACIFTGHTLSDRIETTILNSSRGCGLFGLIGIQQYSFKKDRHFLRPLVFLTKQDIVKNCKEIGITYIQDASNFDTTFTPRNAIRKNLTEYGYCKNQWQKLYNLFDRILVSKSETLIEKEFKTLWNKPLYKVNILTHIDTQTLFYMLGIYGVSTNFVKDFTCFFTQKDTGCRHYRGWNFLRSFGSTYVIAGAYKFWEDTTLINKTTRAHFFNLCMPIESFTTFTPGCKVGSTKVKKLYNTYKIPLFYRHALPIFYEYDKAKSFLASLNNTGLFR